jgi:hypothetical protein
MGPVAAFGVGAILERELELEALSEAFAEAGAGEGRLLLVSGEAGIGKTALVNRFCADVGAAARLLRGVCDALFTPRPLGPLLEVAEAVGGSLEAAVRGGTSSYDVTSALIEELRTSAPSVLVLEDVHWADEATLDVLKLLARRIESVPALVLVSYRDDELDATHPLRHLLGQLVTRRAVRRVPVERLSPEAVATLAGSHGVDPVQLYRRTSGNPFFVTEVLAAPGAQIPATVRDAVLTRCARLGADARSLLEAVAVARPDAELWLLEVLTGRALQSLEECLASGMLEQRPGAVGFRHELARLTVEDSTSPERRIALPHGSPTMRRRRGTWAPCFATLRRRRSGRPRWERIARPRRSMRGCCASPRLSRSRSAPGCTGSVSRSATSAISRTRRSPPRRPRSPATGS